MRIIAGMYRSRRLVPPKDQVTRPMPDRVKESIFNYLREHFDGARILDLFAGTGNIGIEALSRGAAHVLFVERDRDAVKRLRENIRILEIEDDCDVYQGDACSPACLVRAVGPIHLAFLDPPYPLVQEAGESRDSILAQMERIAPLLDPEGFLILRTPWPMRDDSEEPEWLGLESLIGPETRSYKSMALHLYQRR
jgi:16S rRNA (guanine966-N2)-methyltransferase